MPKYHIVLTDGREMEMTADSPPSEAMVLAQMGDQPAEAPKSALERFFSPLLPSTTLSDYWEGPKHALQHPLESAKLLGGAIAKDPMGAVPVVGNVKRGIQDVQDGNYAGAAGEGVAAAASLLPFAKHLPVPSMEGVTGSVGRGMSTVGRGMETFGNATKKPAMSLGALEGVLQDPVKGAMVVGAPYAAEYAGKGMQRLGGALEGLGRREPAMSVDPHLPNASGYTPGGGFGEAADNFQPSHEHGMPNTSGYDPAAGFGDAAERFPPSEAAHDPHMPNTSGYDPAAPFGDSADAFRSSLSDVEHHMPNSSGYESGPRANPMTEAGGGGMYGDVKAGVPDPTWGPGGMREWTGSPLEPVTGSSAPVASEGPSYTDWSRDMDEIINGATASDFPPRKGGLLSNSRPTKADLKFLEEGRLRDAANGIAPPRQLMDQGGTWK